MSDDWSQIQDDLRTGVYGPWEIIRYMLCAEQAERYPDQGISSSDVNHMSYGWAKGLSPLPEADRERAQELWDEGDEYAAWAVVQREVFG